MKTIVYGLNEAKMRKMLELMAQEVESIITAAKGKEETRASLERGDLLVMITAETIEPMPTMPEDGMTQGVVLGIAFEELLDAEEEGLPKVYEASDFITHLVNMHMATMLKGRLAAAEVKDKVMN